MRTVALWKTLVGARFTAENRVNKVAISGNAAYVYYRDGDVETVYLVDFKMPEGEYTGFTTQLALKDLRAYAEGIAEAVGQRADELEDRGREDAAAVLRTLLDLDLFMLLGWVCVNEKDWRVVGRPVLRAGDIELQFPVEASVDSYACWYGSSACKLRRVRHPDLRCEVRDVWLTVATGYWKYVLSQFNI